MVERVGMVELLSGLAEIDTGQEYVFHSELLLAGNAYWWFFSLANVCMSKPGMAYLEAVDDDLIFA